MDFSDIDPHLIHGSLDSNGISIGSAVFTQHTRLTHRQTDHATCDICRNRPCLCTDYIRFGLIIMIMTMTMTIMIIIIKMIGAQISFLQCFDSMVWVMGRASDP